MIAHSTVAQVIALEASDEDLDAAIESALRLAGCSYAELRDQAEAGEFTSAQAQMAWLAIKDIAGS